MLQFLVLLSCLGKLQLKYLSWERVNLSTSKWCRLEHINFFLCSYCARAKPNMDTIILAGRVFLCCGNKISMRKIW